MIGTKQNVNHSLIKLLAFDLDECLDVGQAELISVMVGLDSPSLLDLAREVSAVLALYCDVLVAFEEGLESWKVSVSACMWY